MLHLAGTSITRSRPMLRQSTPSTVATIGIDIGKNIFHLVGLDQRGHVVLQLKTSRGQLDRRLANVPCCLIGMEACSGAHHIGRRLEGYARPGHTSWHNSEVSEVAGDFRSRARIGHCREAAFHPICLWPQLLEFFRLNERDEM